MYRNLFKLNKSFVHCLDKSKVCLTSHLMCSPVTPKQAITQLYVCLWIALADEFLCAFHVKTDWTVSMKL